MPNPRRKGKLSVFNNRAEGYADYKPGMYYVSVFDLVLAENGAAETAAAAEEGSERPQKADVVLPRLQPEVPGHRPAERPDRVPKGCVEETVGDVEELPGG